MERMAGNPDGAERGGAEYIEHDDDDGASGLTSADHKKIEGERGSVYYCGHE